jgi:hypothetical protein
VPVMGNCCEVSLGQPCTTRELDRGGKEGSGRQPRNREYWRKCGAKTQAVCQPGELTTLLFCRRSGGHAGRVWCYEESLEYLVRHAAQRKQWCGLYGGNTTSTVV